MVYLVPTPIGNLKDITFRAIEVFKEADLFLCEDTRVTKQLLLLLDQKVAPCSVNAKFISFNEHNGKERLSQIASKLKELNVVYVSDAGTPCISDPGELLVRYCQENKIEYDVLPGPTASTTAYSASGFEGGKFAFWGFLPHKGVKREEELEQILESKIDVVLYESPHRLLKLLSEISQRDPIRELFLGKELTKKFQKYYLDSAKNLYETLKDSNIKGEWVIVVKKAQNKKETLSFDQILKMELPPKIKAKLLSKISPKSTKQWYEELTKS